ncbi:zinc finger protein 541-like isoform 1-T1 [Ara ararauna]
MHCLHEARGNVLEALELLRQGGPQPNEDHPLAGYHYPGMDTWTPLEQQLFDKAFRKYKNNFHQLQKEIPTKTVSQCVEYYFTWKKKRRLGCRTLLLGGRKTKRLLEEVEEPEEKVLSYPPLATLGQERVTPLPALKIFPISC